MLTDSNQTKSTYLRTPLISSSKTAQRHGVSNEGRGDLRGEAVPATGPGSVLRARGVAGCLRSGKSRLLLFAILEPQESLKTSFKC